MKSTYLTLLVVMAALAGLAMSLRRLPESPVLLSSSNDKNLFSAELEPSDPAHCEYELEFELIDREITEINNHFITDLSSDQIIQGSEFTFDSSIITSDDITLAWIVSQQKSDGGWVACLPEAQMKMKPRLGRNGATGLALLCLLQAGYTHQGKNRYQKPIAAGLQYLLEQFDRENSDLTKRFYSFEDAEGQMISHALATLAICEAYGLTKDKALLPYVQGALDYAAQRQLETGGWPLDRTAAPDLVTTGWIVMALQSGALSYLNVEPAVITAANGFVSRSKPTPENRLRPLELAMWGKLSIIFGATRETRGMTECVRELDKLGISRTNNAYNYVAYSVMRRWDSETRNRWFQQMHKLADEVQETFGANKGSWPPQESNDKQYFWNSRLERTCLIYLSNQFRRGSGWRDFLKDRPEVPDDDSFPL